MAQHNATMPLRRSTLPPMSMADVRARLRELHKEALVDLLVEHGERDERLRERLFLLVSTAVVETGLPVPVDIDDLDRAIRSAIEIQGYIDYRGASMYARQVEEALKVIERVLASPRRDQALRLVETAIAALSQSLNNVDDSGEINEALDQVKSLHRRACEVASLASGELARKLFAAALNHPSYFFDDVCKQYAHVLTDEGRAEFDRLVREAWSALPLLGANQRPPERDTRRSRLQGMMVYLAGDDLEARIEVMKKDLSVAWSFERIARLCIEAGQVERAVTWVQKGLKLFPQRDAKLAKLAQDLYTQLGRHDDLVQLAFDDFAKKLDRATYETLKATCSADAWPAWRTRAVRSVEEQLGQCLKARTKNRWPKFADGTLLVEMLLVEGDVETAREAAEKYGCSEFLTKTLSVNDVPAPTR